VFGDAVRRTTPRDVDSRVRRPEVVRIPDCFIDAIWRNVTCARDAGRDDGTKPFRFVSVFEFRERKGYDVLLKAFYEEFKEDTNVELFVHTFRWNAAQSDPRSDRDYFRTSMARMYSEWGYANVPGSYLRRLTFSTDSKSLEEMPCMMSEFDAFVLPTRGEGWGRPVMEAMAVGVPAIVTNWSSLPDFVRDEWGYLIPAHLVPARLPYCEGNWAVASSAAQTDAARCDASAGGAGERSAWPGVHSEEPPRRDVCADDAEEAGDAGGEVRGLDRR